MEHRNVVERTGDHILGQVPREVTQNTGEHEGNVPDESFGEEGGYSGEHVVRTNIVARAGAVGEDENSVDNLDVLFNISHNTLLVDLVLLNTASAGQPRCVEDTNLRKMLWPLTVLESLGLTNMPLALAIS